MFLYTVKIYGSLLAVCTEEKKALKLAKKIFRQEGEKGNGYTDMVTKIPSDEILKT